MSKKNELIAFKLDHEEHKALIELANRMFEGKKSMAIRYCLHQVLPTIKKGNRK